MTSRGAIAMEWKTSLSMSERYDRILEIQSKIAGRTTQEAANIERSAFEDATSREDYDARCKAVPTPAPNAATFRPSPHFMDAPSSPSPKDTGITIGAYHHCVFVAEGVTSTVYRSGSNALKVVHSTPEPHNPQREVSILRAAKPPCIPLLEVFRDQEQQLVLVFPFMPLTLESHLEQYQGTSEGLPKAQLIAVFRDVLRALVGIHGDGIIHRDIKPSAILLAAPAGPAKLSDFGTAWHPEFSLSTERPDQKILDIGTGPYRSPETLFANRSYGTAVDMWALGTCMAEAGRGPPVPLFESRAAHEDGSQLGLILSIFKTLGSPTIETWPEAASFKVQPFELWTQFPQRQWDEILPDVDSEVRELVKDLVRYDTSDRATAEQALQHPCFQIAQTTS